MKNEGKFYNLENNLVNRTLASHIDDYMLRIYDSVKAAYPNMIGFEAYAIEDGDHVVTKFKMIPKEEACES